MPRIIYDTDSDDEDRVVPVPDVARIREEAGVQLLRNTEPRGAVIVDFFAGCGGFSAGGRVAGCDTILAVDGSDVKVALFNKNFPRKFEDEKHPAVCVKMLLSTRNYDAQSKELMRLIEARRGDRRVHIHGSPSCRSSTHARGEGGVFALHGSESAETLIWFLKFIADCKRQSWYNSWSMEESAVAKYDEAAVTIKLLKRYREEKAWKNASDADIIRQHKTDPHFVTMYYFMMRFNLNLIEMRDGKPHTVRARSDGSPPLGTGRNINAAYLGVPMSRTRFICGEGFDFNDVQRTSMNHVEPKYHKATMRRLETSLQRMYLKVHGRATDSIPCSMHTALQLSDNQDVLTELMEARATQRGHAMPPKNGVYKSVKCHKLDMLSYSLTVAPHTRPKWIQPSEDAAVIGAKCEYYKPYRELGVRELRAFSTFPHDYHVSLSDNEESAHMCVGDSVPPLVAAHIMTRVLRNGSLHQTQVVPWSDRVHTARVLFTMCTLASQTRALASHAVTVVDNRVLLLAGFRDYVDSITDLTDASRKRYVSAVRRYVERNVDSDTLFKEVGGEVWWNAPHPRGRDSGATTNAMRQFKRYTRSKAFADFLKKTALELRYAGAPPRSDARTLKAVRKKWVLRDHPDKGGNADVFAVVNAAFSDKL